MRIATVIILCYFRRLIVCYFHRLLIREMSSVTVSVFVIVCIFCALKFQVLVRMKAIKTPGSDATSASTTTRPDAFKTQTAIF